MSLQDKRGTLSVDMSGGILGVPLMEVEQALEARPMLKAKAIVPTHVAPTTDLTPLLGAILSEVQALRHDLERRSAGGRWKRFCIWVAQGWTRLTGG